MKRLTRAVPLMLFLGLLTSAACPTREVVCSTGQTRAGEKCVDLASDAKHCGAIDNACADFEACSGGECVVACTARGAASCGSTCVSFASDPSNCGACGKSCAEGKLCEAGQCVATCEKPGSTACGQSCADLKVDPAHCGACGNKCAPGLSCSDGVCTHDLVLACFSTDQVRGLQHQGYGLGPLTATGKGPQSLAVLKNALLAAYGLELATEGMKQHQLPAGGTDFTGAAKTATGADPKQLVLADPFLFVLNSSGHTLQLLERTNAPGSDGRFAQGVALSTRATLDLGNNTYPQAVLKVGDKLYVSLFGGFGTTAAAEGQKVVEVAFDAAAKSLAKARTFDLSGLDLKALPGGAPVARPSGLALHEGSLYVALSNLNPTTYEPEGPGMLAKVNLSSGAVSTIDLGAERCLNAGALAAVPAREGKGAVLAVACTGKSTFNADYFAVKAEKAGVLLLGSGDAVKDFRPMECPADAPAYNEKTNTGCPVPQPTRVTPTADGTLYVADQNGGRVFVYQYDGEKLVERRGYAAPDSTPIQACPFPGPTISSMVADILALP